MNASGLSTRIVIQNYHGKPFLMDCLPSIVAAFRKLKILTKINRFDNHSTDQDFGFGGVARYPGFKADVTIKSPETYA